MKEAYINPADFHIYVYNQSGGIIGYNFCAHSPSFILSYARSSYFL